MKIQSPSYGIQLNLRAFGAVDIKMKTENADSSSENSKCGALGATELWFLRQFTKMYVLLLYTVFCPG